MEKTKLSRRSLIANASKLAGTLVVATPIANVLAKDETGKLLERKPSAVPGSYTQIYFHPGYFGDGTYGSYKGTGFFYLNTQSGSIYFQPGYFGMGTYADYRGSGFFSGTAKTGFRFEPGFYSNGTYGTYTGTGFSWFPR